MRKKRRIILTNINASVFKPRFCVTFLSELIVNSLLYDEIFIREGDLIGNRILTEYLKDEFAFQIFSELLSVGAIKILRLSSNSYPSNIRRSPRLFPISARAEDQEINRSDAGKPWKATKWEWELFSRLDKVLKGSSKSHRRQRPFPEENMFSSELSELLVHRQEYKLDKRTAFRDIHPRMAEQFIKFCCEPEAWRRFLRDHRIKTPYGSGRDFYRTQAYQCAERFVPKAWKAMQRLVESTYAACECDRENADGRFGRSALVELPARCENYDEAYNEVRKFEVVPIVPKKTGLKFAVALGIGKVVAEVRRKDAFRQMQECLMKIDTMGETNQEYVDPFRTLNDAWRAVCGEYEEAWANHIHRESILDRTSCSLALWLFRGVSMLGYMTMGLHRELLGQNLNINILAPLDWYIVPRIVHSCPRLSQRVRALIRMPAAGEEMFKAGTSRCTRIELNAKRK